MKLLLRVLEPAAIIDAFQKAGYGPTKTNIYTLSKGLEKETSLSPAEQQRFDGMFRYFSQGMELDPEQGCRSGDSVGDVSSNRADAFFTSKGGWDCNLEVPSCKLGQTVSQEMRASRQNERSSPGSN